MGWNGNALKIKPTMWVVTGFLSSLSMAGGGILGMGAYHFKGTEIEKHWSIESWGSPPQKKQFRSSSLRLVSLQKSWQGLSQGNPRREKLNRASGASTSERLLSPAPNGSTEATATSQGFRPPSLPSLENNPHRFALSTTDSACAHETRSPVPSHPKSSDAEKGEVLRTALFYSDPPVTQSTSGGAARAREILLVVVVGDSRKESAALYDSGLGRFWFNERQGMPGKNTAPFTCVGTPASGVLSRRSWFWNVPLIALLTPFIFPPSVHNGLRVF